MNYYESGGVPPPPLYLRDRQCKCHNCSILFVGTETSLYCDKCRTTIEQMKVPTPGGGGGCAPASFYISMLGGGGSGVSGYGSVDIAEILSAEVENLRAAIRQTLDANGHLADGEVCTLIALKVALGKSGMPWDGDELHNAEVSGSGTEMLERKEVKEGCEYRIDGEPWFVWMIHKSGGGESVTLTSEDYSDAFYERLRTGAVYKKRMQMRKFQKAATLAPNAERGGSEAVLVD